MGIRVIPGKIEKHGDEALRDLIGMFGGWPVLDENWQPPDEPLEVLLGRIRIHLNDPILVTFVVGPDDKNSSANIIQLDQLILALPSREYYSKSNSHTDLMAYHAYMKETAILLGANANFADDEMHEVLEFEILLANV